MVLDVVSGQVLVMDVNWIDAFLCICSHGSCVRLDSYQTGYWFGSIENAA